MTITMTTMTRRRGSRRSRKEKEYCKNIGCDKVQISRIAYHNRFLHCVFKNIQVVSYIMQILLVCHALNGCLISKAVTFGNAYKVVVCGIWMEHNGIYNIIASKCVFRS